MKNLPKAFCLFLALTSASAIPAQDHSSLDFLNRVLGGQEAEVGKSDRRLSSGTLAWSDDPASAAIYDKLKSHVEYLSATLRSRRDMISYYRTWDGYLAALTESLQRIRDLILMKSNGFYGPDEKRILDFEIGLQYDGILKILSWAEFNSRPIFDTWMDDERIQGRFREEQFRTLEGLDAILSTVRMERANIGAIVSSQELSMEGRTEESQNAAAYIGSGDTDFAYEMSNMRRREVLFFAGIFLLETRQP